LRFPELPGIRLFRRRLGWGRFVFVTTDGVVPASVDDGSAWFFAERIRLRSVVIGGEIHSVRRVKESKQRIVTVCNPEAVPLVRGVGTHYSGCDNALAQLSDGRLFRFPVRGEILQAISDSEKTVFWLRRGGRTDDGTDGSTEVVVDPQHPLTSEILLLIAVASGLVETYQHSVGGG
jgi:hypothetical protein